MRRATIFWLLLIAAALVVATWPFGLLGLANSIQVALTVTLVLVTWNYARSAREQAEASKKMVQEMTEQRHNAIIPIIDIQVQKTAGGSGREMIKQGLEAKEGNVPKEMPCICRNIGLGPAASVCHLIGNFDGGPLWKDFGSIGMGEQLEEMKLVLSQRDGRNALVVYYRDIYGQLLESSRDVSVKKENESIEIGPLIIRKPADKELPVSKIAKL